VIRKSMFVAGTRTSVMIEGDFWEYLEQLAAERRVSLAALVNEVAAAMPPGRGLASALRVFALAEARQRIRSSGNGPVRRGPGAE
jgi:predicted DNA-binding ribbon-helix-helix protein